MFDLITLTLFWFLPAYIGNMMPVFLGRIAFLKFLKFPLDRGQYLGSERLLGDHKTLLGLLAGGIGGIIGAFAQLGIMQFFHWPLSVMTIKHFQFPQIIKGGLLMGFCALFGDIFKSFIKRRLKIKSGDVFFPFDQIDFVIGAYLGSLMFFPIPFNIFLTGLIMAPLLHLSANIIAYKLKIKEVWW